jgi:hypothetical protein
MSPVEKPTAPASRPSRTIARMASSSVALGARFAFPMTAPRAVP